MIRFFTGYDVEAAFQKKRDTWPENWYDVQVYRDEVIIYCDIDKNDATINERYLKEIFTRNYDLKQHKIIIDFLKKELDIYYEEAEVKEKRKRRYMPLFKEMCYMNEKESIKEKLPVKLIAFHSYKGGVGRTLSLISVLRQCSVKYPNRKILMIDADMEAPGLTWMNENSVNANISYLDILALMHYDTLTKENVSEIASLIKTCTVKVSTEENQIEQYFVPLYREKEQILDIFSTPEKILYTQEDRFYITQNIAQIGEALGADLILIDLRAGITEYSAPYLFDPRVTKYLVTSTSLQSVKGINQIMNQLCDKLGADMFNIKILLTMIPEVMEESQIVKVENQILTNIENKIDFEDATFLREDYIIRYKFDQALIHIGDFSTLCQNLNGKDISNITDRLIEEIFLTQTNENEDFKEENVRETLKLLYQIAEDEVTAEGNDSANMLVTSSIKELVRNFEKAVPKIVVSGAKGSGKTYIYKQLLTAKTWKNFERIVGSREEIIEDNVLVIPLIASLNARKMRNLIEDAIENVNRELPGFHMKYSAVSDNFQKISDYLEEPEEKTQKAWTEMWINLMLGFFGGQFENLSELDDYLHEKEKKILYIVDGLEDLFINRNGIQGKYAVRAICQYVINKLDNLDYGNIGSIIFIRKDMVADSIETNLEQFQNLYRKYELNWTQTEALRLALWLASKAYPFLGKEINIPTAAKEVLIDRLTLLWGLKLGKPDSREAYCDRWILAALSDFNGELQARDIVRFLKYSTQNYAEAVLQYKDRIIMPVEIRKAIEPCSKDKLADIKNEMQSTYSILEKFYQMDSEQKLLPIALDKISLTGDEIVKLEEQGFLKIDEKKYYLPEIIRRALGFVYEKGARPKVLSFLAK